MDYDPQKGRPPSLPCCPAALILLKPGGNLPAAAVPLSSGHGQRRKPSKRSGFRQLLPWRDPQVRPSSSEPREHTVTRPALANGGGEREKGGESAGRHLWPPGLQAKLHVLCCCLATRDGTQAKHIDARIRARYAIRSSLFSQETTGLADLQMSARGNP